MYKLICFLLATTTLVGCSFGKAPFSLVEYEQVSAWCPDTTTFAKVVTIDPNQSDSGLGYIVAIKNAPSAPSIEKIAPEYRQEYLASWSKAAPIRIKKPTTTLDLCPDSYKVFAVGLYFSENPTFVGPLPMECPTPLAAGTYNLYTFRLWNKGMPWQAAALINPATKQVVCATAPGGVNLPAWVMTRLKQLNLIY